MVSGATGLCQLIKLQICFLIGFCLVAFFWVYGLCRLGLFPNLICKESARNSGWLRWVLVVFAFRKSKSFFLLIRPV